MLPPNEFGGEPIRSDGVNGSIFDGEGGFVRARPG